MGGWHWNRWGLLGSVVWLLGCAYPIVAQVIPDATLPLRERSQVTGNPTVQIDGGARRGGNLFHSFSQFSIPTGGSAYFSNALDVQNIFSRVTGGSASNINGVIRANGTANLFLLNPNGILFGPNASLNIGGSFVATTANAIGFPNGEVFSSDVTQPLPNQLLTINPNALFFNQLIPKSIINRSTSNGTGLQVSPRQNLMLVGGAVQLENARLTSPGSYVELGGVSGVGIVGLATTGEDWQLTIPDGVTRADVSLSNGSAIDVTGDSGSIRMLAQNINISSSELRMGIPINSTLSNAQTGDMDLNATDSITISDLSTLLNALSGQGTIGSINLTAGDRISIDYSFINSTVEQTGVGNAGGINIATGLLSLTNSGQLSADTNGRGNVGSVTINARDAISIDGFKGDFSSAIYSSADSSGVGSAGGINITTGSFSLTNSALLVSYTAGQGDAGNVAIAADSLSVTNGGQFNTLTIGRGKASDVDIRVRGAASFDGIDSFGTPSSILTGVDEAAEGGRGGDLSITAGSLSLTNGATLSAITMGQGSAGNINLAIRDGVLLEGITEGGTGIFTSVGNTGVGNGGNVNLRAGSLSLIGDGAIAADTNGQGRGGNINLSVEGTLLLNGGGRTAPTGESSRITLGVQPGGNGSGGNLRIDAGSLVLANGSLIKASTQGQGDAGNIDITADRVNIFGSTPISGLPSGLFTSSDTAGNAGDITLKTQTFRIADGAALSARSRGDGQGGDIYVNATRTFEAVNGGQLITTTFGQGQAGSITVNAGQITIAGSDPNYADRLAKFPSSIDPLVANAITETGAASGLFANTESSSAGRGGDIQIATQRFGIQDQAEVTVSSAGTGSAGSLFVNADRIFLNNQASIRADTTGGGGNINLRSPFILLRNGSNITTNATGANIPGGNITIDTRFLIAVLSEDSNISANSEDFRGGNVRINAFSIFGIQPSLVSTPLSDITATGATSALSGAIDVITAGLDPTAGLVALPTDLVDSSGLIAQGCPANQGNSFVITGRGGLPPTPEQQLDDDAEWSDRRRLVVGQQTSNRRGVRSLERGVRSRESGARMDSKLTTQNISFGDALRTALRTFPDTPNPKPYTPIIEATGWQVTPTGEVLLVSTTPAPSVENRLNQPVACQGR